MQDSNFHSFEHFSKHFYTPTYSKATNPGRELRAVLTASQEECFATYQRIFTASYSDEVQYFSYFHADFLNHFLSLRSFLCAFLDPTQAQEQDVLSWPCHESPPLREQASRWTVYSAPAINSVNHLFIFASSLVPHKLSMSLCSWPQGSSPSWDFGPDLSCFSFQSNLILARSLLCFGLLSVVSSPSTANKPSPLSSPMHHLGIWGTLAKSFTFSGFCLTIMSKEQSIIFF